MAKALGRYESHGVTLIGAQSPDGVTFAFTERAGGVSEGAFASLNVGCDCGDDDACVQANRSRALAALGAQGLEGALVNPKQVHGSHIVYVRSPRDVPLAQAKARLGADAVVCVCPQVPVLLCSADCVLVVLVAPGGFAVAHSGWRGTIERVAAKAARALAEELAIDPAQLKAYLGPHIREVDYEVSPELAQTFIEAFGTPASPDGRHLNLAFAIEGALAREGVMSCIDACPEASTAQDAERFFSYRANGGECGRIGAFAVMGAHDPEWEVS